MVDNIGKSRNKNIKMLSDEQILGELGSRFEQLRLAARLPDQEIFARGGVKKDALANFKKGRNISLLNFVKILRGANLLDELEQLLHRKDLFSPMALLENPQLAAPKRIRQKKNKPMSFRWGDE